MLRAQNNEAKRLLSRSCGKGEAEEGEDVEGTKKDYSN